MFRCARKFLTLLIAFSNTFPTRGLQRIEEIEMEPRTVRFIMSEVKTPWNSGRRIAERGRKSC